jgi:Domain of unknown function (DUF4129)
VVKAAGPIGRDPAQRLARHELSRSIYHDNSPLQAVLRAIARFFDRLFHGANTTTPGGWWTLVALAALAVIVIAAVFARIGPVARARRAAAPLLSAGSKPLTARQHRDLAEAAAASGDYTQAIIERVRAIATGLEERGVLRPDAGRTADEMAARAAVRVPDHASGLGDAARVFDRVCYGDRSGSADEYEQIRALDEALGRARTLVASHS